MFRIEDFQNNPEWTPSIGERFWDLHFRRNHEHAVCDSLTGDCSIHYDDHDPLESPTELVNHLAGSNLVKGIVLIGVLDALFNNGSLRKKAIRTLLG